MDPHITSTFIAFLGACIVGLGAHYGYTIGDPAAQNAAVALVSFLVGWLRPQLGATVPAPVPVQHPPAD